MPFNPLTGQYNFSAVLIERSDLYDGCLTSHLTPENVAAKISAIDDSLYSLCDSVFVLDISQRFSPKALILNHKLTEAQLRHYSEVNILHQERYQHSGGAYRGIKKFVLCVDNITKIGDISLNPEAPTGTRPVSKERVSYKKI